MPLRAWYPIELLRFPASSPNGHDDSEERTLVADSRLRDALRTLQSTAAGRGSRRFLLPEEGGHLVLTAPDIVDDAAYAVECAAVGEVDIESFERQLDELERRIAWLEAGLWPRILRTITRVVRRRART